MNSINRVKNSAVNLSSTVSKASSSSGVRPTSKVGRGNQARFKFLARIQERPRLISEIAETNRQYSVTQLAHSLLKDVIKETLSIQRYVLGGKRDLSTLNEIDKSKHRIKSLMKTKSHGHYVLASDFEPKLSEIHYIGFKVDGLDTTRLPLVDEVVTLFVANKLLPLVFSRIDSTQERLIRFNKMLALSMMRVELNSDGQLEFFMLDEDWRQWDLQAHLSGQGSRFPGDVAMQIPVKTSVPTMEMLLGLDLKQDDADLKITRVVGHIKSVYSRGVDDLKMLSHKSEELLSLCETGSTEVSKTVQAAMLNDKRSSSVTLKRHYIDIARDNVNTLLEK